MKKWRNTRLVKGKLLKKLEKRGQSKSRRGRRGEGVPIVDGHGTIFLSVFMDVYIDFGL